MLHGLIYARYAERLGDDPGHDSPTKFMHYFGTGTQLQEMYITPSLLSSDDWDVLAEARSGRATTRRSLKDSHWIGGDPRALKLRLGLVDAARKRS